MGTLLRWSEDRAHATGMGEIAYADLVEIEGSGPAIVTGLYDDHVELAPLSSRVPDSGAPIRSRGALVTPTGDDLVGRVVDCLGMPLDGGQPVARDSSRRVFERDPVVLAPHRGRLTLGTLVFDLQRLFPLGSSIVARCTRQARETVHQIVRHQHAAGRTCVIACPTFADALFRTLDVARITVSMGERCTPSAQWLVPWTAMAIASALRDRGRDVVLILDDIDGWRFPVRRMEQRGGWPTQVAQLSSRAYARAEGSVSLIALTRHVDDTLASCFDEVIDLDAFVRGDLGSRGTKLVRPPIKVRSPRRLGWACLAAARLNYLETIPWLEGLAGPDSEDARRVREDFEDGGRIRECLRYRPGGTSDSLEQIVCLLAVVQLDVPAHAVGSFLAEYLEVLRREHASRLAAIRVAEVVEDADLDALLAVAKEVAIRVAAKRPGFLRSLIGRRAPHAYDERMGKGSAEPIGEATMNADGSIVLDLYRPAHARVTYAPSDPKYESIRAHIGPLEPGKSKAVMPWTDDIDDARVAQAVAEHVRSQKGWQRDEWKHEITGTTAAGNVVVVVTFKQDPVMPGTGKSFQLELAPRDYSVVGERHFQ